MAAPMTIFRAVLAIGSCGMMLVGCAAGPPPAPVEVSREVAGTPDVARRQVEARLAVLGFAFAQGPDGPEEPDRPARTGRASPDWAECETVLISGGTNSGQKDFAAPQARSASVTVSYTPLATGTRVDVSTSFEATYHHRYRNLPFTESCRTTGELERALLAAAG